MSTINKMNIREMEMISGGKDYEVDGTSYHVPTETDLFKVPNDLCVKATKYIIREYMNPFMYWLAH